MLTPNSEFRYYDHYHRRLRERPYLEGFAEIVLQSPDATYYDNNTGNLVAVKQVYVLGRDRDVEVAYNIAGNITWVVNLSLLGERQQQNRLREGRWVPYEPDSEL